MVGRDGGIKKREGGGKREMGLNHEPRKSFVIGRPNMVEGSGAYFANRKAIKTRSLPQRFWSRRRWEGWKRLFDDPPLLLPSSRESLVPQTNSFWSAWRECSLIFADLRQTAKILSSTKGPAPRFATTPYSPGLIMISRRLDSAGPLFCAATSLPPLNVSLVHV